MYGITCRVIYLPTPVSPSDLYNSMNVRILMTNTRMPVSSKDTQRKYPIKVPHLSALQKFLACVPYKNTQVCALRK